MTDPRLQRYAIKVLQRCVLACEIGERYKGGGVTYQELADDYGVEKSRIERIVRAHLKRTSQRPANIVQ